MEIKEWTWFNVLLVGVYNGTPKFLAEVPKDGVSLKITSSLDCALLFRVEERGNDVQGWVTWIKKHKPNLEPKIIYVKCDAIYNIEDRHLK